MREPNEPNNLNGPRPRQVAHLGDEPSLGPDLQATEAEWARLRPREAAIDRDRLFYLAGWAAAEAASTNHRSLVARLAWPAALGGVTSIAAVLLGMLMVRPEPTVVERVVYVQHDSDDASANKVRSFAHNAVRSDPEADSGADPRVWTVGHLLRSRDLAAGRHGDDLPPVAMVIEGEPSAPTGKFNTLENVKVLSSRSLESLLEEEALSARGALPPQL